MPLPFSFAAAAAGRFFPAATAVFCQIVKGCLSPQAQISDLRVGGGSSGGQIFSCCNGVFLPSLKLAIGVYAVVKVHGFRVAQFNGFRLNIRPGLV